jgi:hypothetical protein
MSALQKIADETSPRDLRSHKILATAHANLVGHVARDDRVAAALKTARDNIIKFDPKRLASIRALAPAHEEQRATALRKERVARTLRDARDTVARLADMQGSAAQAPAERDRPQDQERCTAAGSAVRATSSRARRRARRRIIMTCNARRSRHSSSRCSIKSATITRKNSMPFSARAIACSANSTSSTANSTSSTANSTSSTASLPTFGRCRHNARSCSLRDLPVLPRRRHARARDRVHWLFTMA